MKRSNSHFRKSRYASFTLIELLVVMGIIAILAGVLFPVATTAINAAKRAKANTTASNIQTAVLAYYTEYSVYPDDTAAFPAGTDYKIDDTDAANWKNLLIALCGNINPATSVSGTSTVSNTRSIAFLNLKSSDLYSTTVVAPKNPLPPDTTHLYFNIAIDNDYDGVVGAGSSAVTSLPNFSSTPFSSTGGGSTTSGVAVWANCNGSSSSTNASSYVHTY